MRKIARSLLALTAIRRDVAGAQRAGVRPGLGRRGGFRFAGQEFIQAVARHNDNGYGERSVERAFRHCAVALGDIEIRAASWQPSDRRPASVEVRLRARGRPRRLQPLSLPLEVLVDAGARGLWIRRKEEAASERENLQATMALQSYLRLHARFSDAQSRADKAALERHRQAERAKIGCKELKR